jgi:hypothetical protein
MSADDGAYAICGVPTGSRALLHASRGDRVSRFVGLFFLSGGVSTGGNFHQLDTPIWHHDLDLLPPEQQTAVVIGQVTDTATAPVAAAEVRVTGTDHITRTDETGQFSFYSLPPGLVRLAVTRLGFRPLERDVVLLSGDTLDLSTSSLEHVPIRLAELTVTAEAPSAKLEEVGFYERRLTGRPGNFLTMEEYRARYGDPVLTTQVLKTMSGLTPRSVLVGEGLGYQTVGFTRCGTNPPALYVDGWYVGTAREADMNFLVPTDWLEAVETHRARPIGNVGYNPSEGCGAIYFWTKPLERVVEEDMPVEPGARVRVTAPAAGISRYVGEYVAGTSDTVYMRGEADAVPLAIPLASVTLLELHTGEKRRRLLGTGVGLSVGVIAGLATGTLDEDRALSAMVLAVPGSFVGFLVGSVLKTDRWEAAVQTAPLVSGISQRETRVGLGVSFRF